MINFQEKTEDNVNFAIDEVISIKEDIFQTRALPKETIFPDNTILFYKYTTFVNSKVSSRY